MILSNHDGTINMYCITDSTGQEFYIDFGQGNEKLLRQYKYYTTPSGFGVSPANAPIPRDYEMFDLGINAKEYIGHPDPILDLQEKAFDVLGVNFVYFMRQLFIPLHNDLVYLELTVM